MLLTGQRRIGKTSLAQELGRQLGAEGWTYLFCDVEAANCPEDVVAEMANAAHTVQSPMKRFRRGLGRWLGDRIEEVGISEFHVKVRAGIDAGNWKRHGRNLLRDCADQERQVFLVIDELPIFLQRMLDHDQHARRVDEFLSWLRGELQRLALDGPVLMVSGSIGLQPLVRRLGIPDRINHLYSYRLGPWDRNTCIRCFERLARSNELPVDDGVAGAVYDKLGIGIPHHVQSFFARLNDYAAMHGLDQVTAEHVAIVYRTELLGPSGQIDLDHYKSRLKDALTEDSYAIALRVLAEAAIQDVFTRRARRALEREYGRISPDPRERIAEVLDVLEHDGYLVAGAEGYRFQFRLLKEWWAARFRDHYAPMA